MTAKTRYSPDAIPESAFEYVPDEDEYFETGDYEELAPHMGVRRCVHGLRAP